ncbi:hypothetical protein BCR44DRAFT_1435319 [Catenaria anguillulae PL171]|uniref:Disintegrin and metalloproteinase domain-containing protein B n=1 Tax=Catenaria anguillulae PL171 TaxID=765915 RepID=A0A1Y2HLM4_9FUNG|nr:hypothetical protein BCR44DRAFT_1435319 [Catenaria anguillulae PL171]
MTVRSADSHDDLHVLRRRKRQTGNAHREAAEPLHIQRNRESMDSPSHGGESPATVHPHHGWPRRTKIYVAIVAAWMLLDCTGSWTFGQSTGRRTRRGVNLDGTNAATHQLVQVIAHVPGSAEPVDLYSRSKKDSTPVAFPKELQLSLTAEESALELLVEHNEHLMAPSYRHVYSHEQTDQAAVKARSGRALEHLERAENCFYTGTLLGHPSSIVAISTCDGVNGFIEFNRTARYSIHALAEKDVPTKNRASIPQRQEPLLDSLPTTVTRRHALIREPSNQEAAHHSACAVDSTSPPASLPEPPRSPLTPQRPFSSSSNLVMELMLANDYERYQEWGADTEISALELANYASALYKRGSNLVTPPPTLSIAVRALPTNANTFLAYNDVGHLLTSRVLTSTSSGAAGAASIEGYAYVSAMCRADRACGVVRGVKMANMGYQAVTLAHELGHNLGMSHDGSSGCAANGFIMQAASCANCPSLVSQWSDCSQSQLNTFLTSGAGSCLSNEPRLCGNGVVDPFEECDSGNPINGSSCCTSTCRLRAGAQCDDRNGPCCSNCQFRSAGTQCRGLSTNSVQAPCDIADTCSGDSFACPNMLKSNGTKCTYTPASSTTPINGTCNRGYCQSRATLCASMGNTYSPLCDQMGDNACVLYCSTSTDPSQPGCVSYRYSSGMAVAVPDFAPCNLTSVRRGSCLAGVCQYESTLNETGTGSDKPSWGQRRWEMPGWAGVGGWVALMMAAAMIV